MSKPNDGGSAYPAMAHHSDRWPTGGMTLRDYFAGLALQGEMAGQSDSNGIGVVFSEISDANLVERALFFYRLADAMLVARSPPDNAGAQREP